jgi:cystathionine gamma-synthase
MFIFTSPDSAAECIEFAVRGPRINDENLAALAPGPDTMPMSRDQLSLRVLEVEKTGQRLYAVIFPFAKFPRLLNFWANTGTGMPSRLAEECLLHIDTLREIPSDSPPSKSSESPAYSEIKERIVSLLERSPVGGPRSVKVSQDDVFLFQSGMTAIYQTHKYLLIANSHTQKSALFGFAFSSTLRVFSDWGPGYKLLARGTDNELRTLTQFLETEKNEGRKVQAIWAEFPSNPSLTTPNLSKLRQIADDNGCLLIIDDTIGSFANIDLLGAEGTDILITSLTKSFSGYADAMGGSAVLNPLRPRYSELKNLFFKHYRLDYSHLDAQVMASNSRDYLARNTIQNYNTQTLVNYFVAQSLNFTSSIKSVQHPTTNPSFRANFDAVKRPATEEYTPGYGFLFSVEFASLEKLQAFYDRLNIHVGPHLGAHRTIVLTYVKAMYGKDLEWAEKTGLSECSKYNFFFFRFFVLCDEVLLMKRVSSVENRAGFGECGSFDSGLCECD